MLHETSLPAALLQRLASSLTATSSRQAASRRLVPAARKSRPFARPRQEQPAELDAGQFTPEELAAAANTELTDEQVLTQAYLQSLEDETWADDPPDHRSGTPVTMSSFDPFCPGRHWLQGHAVPACLSLQTACPGYVAIVGRPNAGKSTLVNALVGQKLSIVTAKAQTTRHRILSLVNDESWQMILLDTPGILKVCRRARLASSLAPVWRSAR